MTMSVQVTAESSAIYLTSPAIFENRFFLTL
jgi:hypothetical protein